MKRINWEFYGKIRFFLKIFGSVVTTGLACWQPFSTIVRMMGCFLDKSTRYLAGNPSRSYHELSLFFCLFFFFVIVSDDGLLCRKSNLAELFLLSGNIFSGIDIDIGRQLIQSPPASHICLCSRKNKKTKKQNKNGWEFGLSHSLFSIVLLSIERKERRRSFLYAVFIQPYAAINTKKKLMPVSIYY